MSLFSGIVTEICDFGALLTSILVFRGLGSAIDGVKAHVEDFCIGDIWAGSVLSDFLELIHDYRHRLSGLQTLFKHEPFSGLLDSLSPGEHLQMAQHGCKRLGEMVAGRANTLHHHPLAFCLNQSLPL